MGEDPTGFDLGLNKDATLSIVQLWHMLNGPENGLDLWRMADEWPDWFVHDIRYIMSSIGYESAKMRKQNKRRKKRR